MLWAKQCWLCYSRDERQCWLHATRWLLPVLCFIKKFCSSIEAEKLTPEKTWGFDGDTEVLEVANRCAAEGGSMISASYKKEALHIESWSWPSSGHPACVPRKCSTVASMDNVFCFNVLQEVLLRVAGSTPQERTANNNRWFLEGVPMSIGPQDRVAHKNSRVAPSRFLDERLHLAVVGHHGPLSIRVRDHLVEATARFVEDTVSVALYGQCYLCSEIPECFSWSVPILGSRLCEWFHSGHRDSIQAAEKSEDEVQIAARSIAEHEPQPILVVCLFAYFCFHLFRALPDSIARMQLLCMHPLQGVPTGLSSEVLLDLRTRAIRGEAIYSTNVVTTSLLSYHAGFNEQSGLALAPALSLFSRHLHEESAQAPPRSKAKLLVAWNFLLMHSGPIREFVEALISQAGVAEQRTRWNFSDAGELARTLEFSAVVFIPEVPYKNLFNDFYSLALPLFVPDLGLAARFCSNVQPLESHDFYDIYDGWFNRNISRARLHEALAEPEPPEPFDLSVDGEMKLLHWMRLADYYHFPGVQSFFGMVDLFHKLDSSDLNAASAAMKKYYKEQHAVTVSIFQRSLARLL